MRNLILRNTWYSKRQEELRIKIQEIYNENNQIFVTAKIAAVLKEQGYRTSEKTVRKLMRDMGLISIRQDAKSIYDNSVMESFFSSLKREELYRTKYRSEKELRTAIDNYMLFYNEKHPHAQNGYKTPLRKETEYRERQKRQSENGHRFNTPWYHADLHYFKSDYGGSDSVIFHV